MPELKEEIIQEQPEETQPTENKQKKDTLVELRNPDKKYDSQSVVRLNLTEKQEAYFLDIIKRETYRTEEEYNEEDYYPKYYKSLDDYNLVKEPSDFPIENASNRRLGLLMIMSEMIGDMSRRQTMSARPIIRLEKDEEIEDKDVTDWENLLDYRLRTYTCHSDVSYQGSKWGACCGGAVFKIPFVHKSEWYTTVKTYTPASVGEYEKKYGKLLAMYDEKAMDVWQRLVDGEDVNVREEEEKVVYHGAKPYFVPLDKFKARLSIKDFNDHIVITEQMDHSWIDIQNRVDSDFYDEEKVEMLKESKGAEYLSADYTIMESDLYCPMPEKDGTVKDTRLRRLKLTYDAEKEIFVRSIFFPYQHHKVDYACYTAFPKANSWLGYRLSDKLSDVVEMAEAELNGYINEMSLQQSPNIFVRGAKATDRLARMELEGSAINIIGLPKDAQVDQLRFGMNSGERLKFLQFLLDFADLVSGVKASLMSGGETPHDPQAPASKLALKFKAGQIRLENIISNLQESGDEKIAEQIDKLYSQYPEAVKEGKLEVYMDGQKKEYDANLFNKKVRYVCSGKTTALDKGADMNTVMGTMEMLAKAYPQVFKDIDVQYTILKAYLDNAEGSIQNNKEKILKPLKLMVDAKKSIKGGYEKTENGKVAQLMRKMGGGRMPLQQAGQGQPGQPQGQPPAPQGPAPAPEGQMPSEQPIPGEMNV